MKNVLTLVFVLVLSSAIAQDTFTFNYIDAKLDDSELSPTAVKPHYLGEGISKKIALVENDYTWMEEASATSLSPKTVVEKFPIYSSIKKLNRHYKKAVKKGGISKDEAEMKFVRALDIALCIRFQDTRALEAELNKIKDINELENLFTSKVFLSGSDVYSSGFARSNK